MSRLSPRDVALALTGSALSLFAAAFLFDPLCLRFGAAEGLILLCAAALLCLIGHRFQKNPLLLGGLIVLNLSVALLVLLMVSTIT